MIERFEPRPRGERSLEIQHLLFRVNALVRMRELLRERGVSESVLDEHNTEIGRLRWRIEGLVREIDWDQEWCAS